MRKLTVLLFLIALSLALVASASRFDETIDELADGIAELLLADSDAQMCVNSESGLNVRDGNGNLKRTLSNNAQVQTFETKFMRGETFVRIGGNEYVAQRFLRSCGGAPTPAPTPSGGNKVSETLKLIFGHEGKCQNWASDSGNNFQGKIGYTCMGITPSVGYNNRNGPFSYAKSFSGHPADFVKHAYDLSPAKFQQGASEVYSNQYFAPGGCSPLPQPIFYVCADIAVNSGVGRSKQYLNELGMWKSGQDIKAYARRLNERHRQDYKRWGSSGPNAKFLQGWLARAAARDQYINNYRL